MSPLELFSYSFIWQALAGGLLIAIFTSLIGTFLVLKRFSLMGDSLSHVALSGVAIGFLTKTSPLFVALPLVILSALGIIKLTKNEKIYADSALGIISALGIALGLIIAALAGGFNVDLMGFLFGSILTISKAEVLLAAVLAILSLILISYYYHELVAMTFDENFAKTAGINTEKINTLLIVFSAACIVIALKAVGIMLVSALIIVPPSAALQIANSFKKTLIYSCIFSCASIILGIYFSFLLNLPSGAVIILINLLILFIILGIKYAFKKRKIA